MSGKDRPERLCSIGPRGVLRRAPSPVVEENGRTQTLALRAPDERAELQCAVANDNRIGSGESLTFCADGDGRGDQEGQQNAYYRHSFLQMLVRQSDRAQSDSPARAGSRDSAARSDDTASDRAGEAEDRPADEPRQ